MANPFKLNNVKARLEQSKRDLPIVIAKKTEQHFTEAFTKGGLDEHVWPESKRRQPGEIAYRWKPKGISEQRWHSNPTLVGVTGNLRRKVSRSIMNATWALIRLVVDVPYAQYHNTKMAGSTWRPFLIQTKTLRDIQLKALKEKINSIWRN